MRIFVDNNEAIVSVGANYLRIEGAFYILIGYLFMFYGFFRGVGKPSMSIVLTVLSLGTRVVLAYTFAPMESFGVYAIWWAIPIGWAIADITGFWKIKKYIIKKG